MLHFQEYMGLLSEGFETIHILEHCGSAHHMGSGIITGFDIDAVFPGSMFTAVWGCGSGFDIPIHYVHGESMGLAAIGVNQGAVLAGIREEALFASLMGGTNLGESYLAYLKYQFNPKKVARWYTSSSYVAVDFLELQNLADHWLAVNCDLSDNCEGADEDASENVNFVDMAMLAHFWRHNRRISTFMFDFVMWGNPLIRLGGSRNNNIVVQP